jgi:hypothetical protein
MPTKALSCCRPVVSRVQGPSPVSDSTHLRDSLWLKLITSPPGGFYPASDYNANNRYHGPGGPSIPRPPLQFFAFLLKRNFKLRLAGSKVTDLRDILKHIPES